MNDVFIRIMDLPISVKGMTTLDENGDYNTYINARYSHEMRREIWEHEKAHIEKGHFRGLIDQTFEVARSRLKLMRRA